MTGASESEICARRQDLETPPDSQRQNVGREHPGRQQRETTKEENMLDSAAALFLLLSLRARVCSRKHPPPSLPSPLIPPQPSLLNLRLDPSRPPKVALHKPALDSLASVIEFGPFARAAFGCPFYVAFVRCEPGEFSAEKRAESRAFLQRKSCRGRGRGGRRGLCLINR